MAESEAEEIQSIKCSVLMYRHNLAYKFEEWFYRKLDIQHNKQVQRQYHKYICENLEIHANRIYVKQQQPVYEVFRRHHEIRNRRKLVVIKQQILTKRLQQKTTNKTINNNNNENAGQPPMPKRTQSMPMPKLTVKSEPMNVPFEDPVVCSQQILDLTQEYMTHASIDGDGVASQSFHCPIKIKHEDEDDMMNIDSEDVVTYNEKLFSNLPTSSQKI